MYLFITLQLVTWLSPLQALLGDDSGFDLSGRIDLRARGKALAASYEQGAIVSLLYERGGCPPEESMLEQLDLAKEAYAAVRPPG